MDDPDEPPFDIRCLPVPDVRMDGDGVWQLDRFAWFAGWPARDRWCAYAYAYTPAPSRSHGWRTFERRLPRIAGAIGLVGASWSQIQASPTAIAGLQLLCLQVMQPDLSALLEEIAPLQGEALRDAIQADIEAGMATPFSLLRAL